MLNLLLIQVVARKSSRTSITRMSKEKYWPGTFVKFWSCASLCGTHQESHAVALGYGRRGDGFDGVAARERVELCGEGFRGTASLGGILGQAGGDYVVEGRRDGRI